MKFLTPPPPTILKGLSALAVVIAISALPLSASDLKTNRFRSEAPSSADFSEPAEPVRRAKALPRRSEINPASTNVTPLHWASIENRPEEVQALLESGADPSAREQLYGGETPLHWAANADSSGAVRVLLANGASINAQDDYGETAIHESLRRSDAHWLALSALLTSGGNPNLSGSSGRTPLMEAVTLDHVDASSAVWLLINFGANVNAVRSDGGTALLLAAALDSSHAWGLINILLNANANPNARYPNNGNTVLHLATEFEHLHGAIRRIRQAGANPNVTAGRYAHSPLHIAIVHGSFDAVSALLDDDADLGPPANIDATDNRGATALHWLSGFIIGAAEHPSAIKVLRLLADEGVDINKRTPDGSTALGIALANGYTDIVEQLQDYGGIL